MLNTAMYSRIVVKLQGMMYRATQLLKQLNTHKSNLKLIKNLFELKKNWSLSVEIDFNKALSNKYFSKQTYNNLLLY